MPEELLEFENTVEDRIGPGRVTGSLATAAGLGAVTGLRSMMGAAVAAHELSGRGLPRRRPRHAAARLVRWLTRPAVARTLELLALGEVIADKLPGVPDRIAPGPLVGRAAIGGLLGSVAGGDRRVAGSVVGAGSAVAAAFAGWWLRRAGARATYLPDGALAVAEDAVALGVGRRVAASL